MTFRKTTLATGFVFAASMALVFVTPFVSPTNALAKKKDSEKDKDKEKEKKKEKKKDKKKDKHDKKGDKDSNGKVKNTCSDRDLADWKKMATSIELKEPAKVIVDALLIPLTTPLGFWASDLLRFLAEVGATLKHPDCFARIVSSEVKRIGKAFKDAGKKMNPKDFAKDPCGTPSKAWLGLLEDLKKSIIFKSLPIPIKTGIFALFAVTVPPICAMGVAVYGVKSAIDKLMDSKIVPVIANTLINLLLGKDAKEKVLAVVQKALGAIDKVGDYTDQVLGMVEAIEKKSKTAFDAAKRKFSDVASGWLSLTPEKLVEGLRAMLKDEVAGAIDLVLAEVSALLNKFAGPLLGAARQAVVTAVGSIPFAGGALAGLVGFAFDAAADLLLSLLVDGAKVLVKKLADKVIDAVCNAISKKSGAVPDKELKDLQKIVGKLLGAAESALAAVKKVGEKAKATSDRLQQSFDRATSATQEK